MRRISSVVPPILLLLLLVAPSIGATAGEERPRDDACRSEPGRLLVPTGSATAPIHLTQFTQGTYAWLVTGIASNQGDRFTLEPGPGTTFSTINGRLFPDFHIAWYVQNGVFLSQVGINNTDGSEVGHVPHTATAAVIWMQYGPDTGTSDGGYPGATFVLSIDC